MKKVLKVFGRILAAILILALLAVIALVVIPLTERVNKAPAAGADSWKTSSSRLLPFPLLPSSSVRCSHCWPCSPQHCLVVC